MLVTDPRENNASCEGDDVESLGGVGSYMRGLLLDDLHHGDKKTERRKERGLFAAGQWK